jgi:hypothetical protein
MLGSTTSRKPPRMYRSTYARSAGSENIAQGEGTNARLEEFAGLCRVRCNGFRPKHQGRVSRVCRKYPPEAFRPNHRKRFRPPKIAGGYLLCLGMILLRLHQRKATADVPTHRGGAFADCASVGRRTLPDGVSQQGPPQSRKSSDSRNTPPGGLLISANNRRA